MGLDVSHGCWSGGYIGFHFWRCKLAQVAGLPPLEMMEDFYDRDRWWASVRDAGTGGMMRHVRLDQRATNISSTVTDNMEQLPIRWACLRPDPLHILLRHSDCDGSIDWIDCEPIAQRLEELVPLLPEGDGPGHVRNWKDTTAKFASGLREAGRAKEDVVFG